MAARSAGLMLFRRRDPAPAEVLLAHMGGPLWASRDEQAWSIPKGEYVDPEEPFEAARREFAEELGQVPPAGEAVELGELRQPNGKRIRVWAIEADMDPAGARSNTFQMEWPPRSGQVREFPEVDRAAWFDLDTARAKLVRGQVPFIDLLLRQLQGQDAASARAGEAARTPTVPARTPTVPDRTPTVPDHASTVPDHASTVPDHASTVPAHAPTVPAHAPTVPAPRPENRPPAGSGPIPERQPGEKEKTDR